MPTPTRSLKLIDRHAHHPFAAPPTLTTVPKDADLVSGRSAVIECAASGQPRPSISWLRARGKSAISFPASVGVLVEKKRAREKER